MKAKKLKEIKVYNKAEDLAMHIFEVTKTFPNEEKYSLIDQIRRSSRSVAANIAEAWGKRKYQGLFRRHIIDANGSLEETKSWLSMSKRCQYIDEKKYQVLSNECSHIGAQLFFLEKNWKFNSE